MGLTPDGKKAYNRLLKKAELTEEEEEAIRYYEKKEQDANALCRAWDRIIKGKKQKARA